MCIQSIYHPASFRRAHKGPVEDVAFEPMYMRLVSVGQGALQIWIMNKDCELPRYTHIKVYTDSIKEIHPPIAKKPYIVKSMQVCDHSKVLLVFFLESHEMYVLWNLCFH
jgi:hypothetical protein